MHCELLVPHLQESGTRSASLERVAARGRRLQATPSTGAFWLQEAFGLEGRMNAGAISLLGAGGAPGDAAWARADPVHIEARRDGALTVPAAAFPVSAEEARALCDALSLHFTETMEFRPLDAQHWCVRVAADVGEMPPLDRAAAEYPVGPEDALLTEVQMLLHAHPVNAAREARGEPVLNSVWFWGWGRLPHSAACSWRSVTSADPYTLGLARLAGASARQLPSDAATWLAQSPEDGRHLLTLNVTDPALERDWFAPLADALGAGRIGMLTLHVPEIGLSFETIRGDLRRFWRRSKPLLSYA